MATTGGSFGVVYKAIEKETGKIVAIKHVGIPFSKSCTGHEDDNVFHGALYRSTLKLPRMTLRRSSRKFPSWVIVQVHMSQGTMAAS